MRFPYFPKRKADALSNGVFLILLGALFYSGYWWPGILFAIGATLAIRQYLTGRRTDFLITITLIGLLGILTLAGKIFSLVFPLLFVGLGLYLITKECLPYRNSSWKKPTSSMDE